jgi:hypothetical protein
MKAFRTGLIAIGAQLAVAAPAMANDFPTQARVEYVLRCMDANGGQSYNTLYACVCSIDRTAESFSYGTLRRRKRSLCCVRRRASKAVFRDPDNWPSSEEISGGRLASRAVPFRRAQGSIPSDQK